MANLSKTDFATETGETPATRTTVLEELMAAFREADPDLDQIVKLIAIEPAFAAEVLKLSNSVSFAGNEPTTDVFEAVSRIGIREAYSTVMTLTHSQPAHRSLNRGRS
jgi:HD-like signal output (HDOD) protein